MLLLLNEFNSLHISTATMYTAKQHYPTLSYIPFKSQALIMEDRGITPNLREKAKIHYH